MPAMRSTIRIELSTDEQAELERIVRSHTAQQWHVVRAQTILLLKHGPPQLAERLGQETVDTVVCAGAATAAPARLPSSSNLSAAFRSRSAPTALLDAETDCQYQDRLPIPRSHSVRRHAGAHASAIEPSTLLNRADDTSSASPSSTIRCCSGS